MVDDQTLDKVLDKVKIIISTEIFEDTKILIETHDKLPDDVTLCFLFQTALISPGQNVWILLIFLV